MHPQPVTWREVAIGETAIIVSHCEPVAIVRRLRHADLLVSWPDLDVGLRSPTATVLRAPTGAWVLYRPMESEDPATPPGEPAAIHVAWDGTLTRFVALQASHLLGATRHGLWLSTLPSPHPRDLSAWSSTDELVVLGPDSVQRRVSSDRRAAFAVDDGERPMLLLYAAAPEPVRTWGGTSFAHELLQVALPADDVPRTTGDGAQPFSEDELRDVIDVIGVRDVDNEPNDPGLRWNRVEITEADCESAVAAVRSEFAHLANYWRGEDGRTSPLSHGLSDPSVDVEGTWPFTRVEVSFRHPHYVQGRLRRTIRVFDDAGRVSPALYASIHLMEDLSTGRLPSPELAHDGVLDI